MKTYRIETCDGQVKTTTSLRKAKALARHMSRPVLGSGVVMPAKRLYWHEWLDGSLAGDSSYGYEGENPTVLISVEQPRKEQEE